MNTQYGLESQKNKFINAKESYNEARETQRKILVNMLKNEGYKVFEGPRAGKGSTKYTAGKELDISYDLSNWKWVSGVKSSNEVSIYLQSFDRDPKSRNYHVLFDRISIQINNLEIKRTEFELPLDDNILEKLAELIFQEIEKQN
ncbi:hypothetical protein [Vagococcus humatus]|jgi:hypothetical protein|uniref:Uncharacterized protein n=1 Tax=Vagococcus humatus TaxID=1889241 RepID=A0A3R9YWP7_9ENTE|nr:hypothetical protein [Vagococcus humatus]MDR2278140.1 hypothetical protein [Vagococcus sp.]RST89092.1 hypothetical protein C7P63_07335 [Vagococcus humatus]